MLHGDARQRIELAQRLIENEKLWVVNQCPRQSRALRHPARKPAWISRGETSKADQSQRVIDPFAMASKQPAVYMSNHQSQLDPPYLLGAIPVHAVYIAKKELKWVPFIGWNMALNRYVPLVRGDRESVGRMMAACERWLVT